MNKAQTESLEYNQCAKAVQQLNDFLSHELQPEEEELVQKHLLECNGCLEKFRFETTLLRTLREKVGHVQAPDGLRERILGLLHKSS